VKVPKVSVVLTTYNRARVLGPTIQTILAQTLEDFELVISDDASQDDTARICLDYEKRDHRVRYRRGVKNVGMPGNLNAGIEASVGEYIANLHDGDLYDPTLLAKWTAALDRFPGAAFVFNAYRVVDIDGRTACVYREPLEPCVPGSVLLEQIFFRSWRFGSPVWGTVMGRRSAYLQVGLFDPRFGFTSDVDMWLRLAEHFDVAYVSEPLIVLPCREAVPRIWNGAEALAQRQVERMFWEARMRHYHHRPVGQSIEAIRHCSFAAAARGWQVACWLNRQLRLVRRLAHGGSRILS
jgi:GT2 family glycosyltransferase